MEIPLKYIKHEQDCSSECYVIYFTLFFEVNSYYFSWVEMF